MIPSKAEIDFIESIDACFPFHDRGAAQNLVRQGAAISDNAALMVAYELAFADERVPTALRLDLLKLLVEQRPTPLVLAARPVAESFIVNQPPESAAVEALLRACQIGQPCYNALNLLAECSPDYEAIAEQIRSRDSQSGDSN